MNFEKFDDAKKDDSVLNSFTRDQKIAYENLVAFIEKGYVAGDYKRALIGSAGTGKTYMIREVIKRCGLAKSVIGLAAPTHKAARVLRLSTGYATSTVASDLGLRLNTDVTDFDVNNPPFDPLSEKKIKQYKLYIVDEASMIGNNLRTLIERECEQFGCMLIYMGDAHQLMPVKETRSRCFDNIKFYTLRQIVRQEESNPVSELLRILRKDIDNRTWKFLEFINRNRYAFDSTQTKGYYTCGLFEFQSLVIDGFYNEEFTRDVDTCRLVTYTNKSVSDWNKFIRKSIIEDSAKAILTKNDLVMAYNTFVDDFKDTIIVNSEDYIIHDIKNFTNRDSIHGFNVTFIQVNGGNRTKPLFVVDHSDFNNVMLYYKLGESYIYNAINADKYNRTKRWKEYYEFRERNLLLVNLLDKATNKIKFSRDLDYGFALTANKAQGSTYADVYVDINDIVFDTRTGNPWGNIDETLRRLYTACSRCKNRLYLCYGQ